MGRASMGRCPLGCENVCSSLRGPVALGNLLGAGQVDVYHGMHLDSEKENWRMGRTIMDLLKFKYTAHWLDLLPFLLFLHIPFRCWLFQWPLPSP